MKELSVTTTVIAELLEVLNVLLQIDNAPLKASGFSADSWSFGTPPLYLRA